MRMQFKGTVPAKESLPKGDNQIGDFWAIAGDPHLWVWTSAGGAMPLVNLQRSPSRFGEWNAEKINWWNMEKSQGVDPAGGGVRRALLTT
jgi:hypothetical protein